MATQVTYDHIFSDSETDIGSETESEDESWTESKTSVRAKHTAPTKKQMHSDENTLDQQHDYVMVNDVPNGHDEEEQESKTRVVSKPKPIMTRFLGALGSLGLSPRQQQISTNPPPDSRTRGGSDSVLQSHQATANPHQTGQTTKVGVSYLESLGVKVPSEAEQLLPERNRVVYQIAKNEMKKQQMLWIQSSPQRIGGEWVQLAKKCCPEYDIPCTLSEAEIRMLTQTLPHNAATMEQVDQIQRDVPRTVPHFGKLMAGGEEKLACLLLAISELYPNVRYVQGMNFIGSVVLFQCNMDLPMALQLFQILMSHPKYKLETLYSEGLTDVMKYNTWLQSILKAIEPELFQYLESIGLGELFFSYQWIITLFSASMPLHVLVDVWTYFFKHGWEGILRVCIVLLTSQTRKLMSSDFETCAKILRRSPWVLSGEDLLSQASKLELPSPPSIPNEASPPQQT